MEKRCFHPSGIFYRCLCKLLSQWIFTGESYIPLFLSMFSLIPLYLWQTSYKQKAKLSEEINGRPQGTVVFLAFSLFLLALLVRIPSVLLFNMPHEKAPLIYLLILTIILIEGKNVSVFGFKKQKMVKALFYGAVFYMIFGGTSIFLQCLLMYIITNQAPASFAVSAFILSMPFQTLLVGISEEGLFRGYIQTHLQKFYAYKAVLIQAILFGFWHFVWNLSPFDPYGMALYITETF